MFLLNLGIFNLLEGIFLGWSISGLRSGQCQKLLLSHKFLIIPLALLSLLPLLIELQICLPFLKFLSFFLRQALSPCNSSCLRLLPLALKPHDFLFVSEIFIDAPLFLPLLQTFIHIDPLHFLLESLSSFPGYPFTFRYGCAFASSVRLSNVP